MRKVFASFIFTAFLFLFTAGNVHAANLTVTCANEGPCTTSGSNPLFNETNWVPGSTITHTITVVNEDSDDPCNLTLDTSNEVQSPSNFASSLATTLDDGGSTYFNSTLQSVFNSGAVGLGTVSTSSTKVYNWSVTFDPNAGNEFQSSQAVFDFDLAFSCIGPTPTPTSSPSSGGGGGLVAGTSTECSSTIPSTAPFLTSAANGPNSVSLSWTSVTPVTHYMIRYGTSSGNYIYGASNVGNVNSFIVNLLSGGTTYYFQVAGVNNCMPGPWSNEVVRTPGGVVLPPGPAEGFTEEILGVETEVSPTPSPTSAPVLGTEDVTCQDKYYPWWIPLVIQALAGFVYLKWRWSDKRWWAIVGLFAIVSQIVHWILKCNCATGELCPWYWLFNLIITGVLILYYHYEKRRKKENNA